MPDTAIQQILTIFEIGFFLIGVGLIGRFVFKAEFRVRWWHANHLPAWPIAPSEFALYFLALFSGVLVLQSLLHWWLGDFIAKSADQAGLEVIINGTGLDGGAFLGWLLFPKLQRVWHFDHTATLPIEPPASPVLSWGKTFLYGAGALAVSLPLVAGVSFAWGFLLKKIGLPDDPQDSIAIFSNAKSPWVVAGMLIVACGFAPVMEELLFRAGVYRFCRNYFGRGSSILISGLLFGAIHVNWAGFLPLSIFGMLLAVMYETTGSIRVAIVAHAFFNLNTILAILSGLTQ